MKRILLMIFRSFYIFPYLYFKLLMVAKFDKYTEEERYAHLRKITYYANKGGRVEIECQGLENIPAENGYILYPNHQGMYDVLTMIDTHEKPLSIVAKKELKKIPMLNKVFTAMRAFYMDREDVRQSLQIIKQVAAEVEKGRNYVIFPEGTRSRQGNVLGEFKGGSFKAATKAKCPIVPVALVDAFKPFDSKSTKPVTVKICYMKPMLYEEYKDLKSTQIAEIVKNRIIDKIAEME